MKLKLTTFIENFSEISHRYRLLICDLWGCIHNGIHSFDESLLALKKFRGGGGSVVLVTNAPRPRLSVEKQILNLGINKNHYDLLLTSGELTSEFVATRYSKEIQVFHIGNSYHLSLFANVENYNPLAKTILVPLKQAQLIICTEPFNPVKDTLEKYKDILMAGIDQDLPFICANPDLIVDVGPERQLCAGSIASVYQKMGGEVIYFGKPYKEIYDRVYDYAKKKDNVEKSNILCIGDGINTDIKGAATEQLDSLLVLGGLLKDRFLINNDGRLRINKRKFSSESLKNKIIEPTFVIKHFQ
jgi:HAD superfamily hydrolase (TIGR01459 family)